MSGGTFREATSREFGGAKSMGISQQESGATNPDRQVQFAVVLAQCRPMKRAVADLKKSAAGYESTSRTQRDLSSKVVFGGLAAVFVCMVALYYYFAGQIA